MDRKLIAAIAAIAVGVVVAATSAFAHAASGALPTTGQVLCLSGQSPATGPNSSGQCKSGQTRVTLATESEVTTLEQQVTALQGQVTSLQDKNAALSADDAALKTTLSKVSYDPQGT